MNGTNELQKLKALRDSERKQLAALTEQRDRALREHDARITQLLDQMDRCASSIETWNNLINLLEENKGAT